MAGDIEVVDLELSGPVTVHANAWTDVDAGHDIDSMPASPDPRGRNLQLVVDKPEALGGSDQGPMPSEYLLVALGSCMLMTMRRIAEKRKVTWSRLTCRAFARIDGNDIGGIDLRFRALSEADDDAWDTILRLASKICTISRALSCPLEKSIEVESPPTQDVED